MNEEMVQIKESVRKEKIINFFKNNKKKIIIFILLVILLINFYYFFNKFSQIKREKISDNYIYASVLLDNDKKNEAKKIFKNIILENKSPYALLSLYQIMKFENNLTEISNFIDILIEKNDDQKDLRDLLIYKKNLLLSETREENEILLSMNKIINSESLWKDHALIFLGDYYFSKKKFDNSKEFYQRVLLNNEADPLLKKEADSRIKKITNVQN